MREWLSHFASYFRWGAIGLGNHSKCLRCCRLRREWQERISRIPAPDPPTQIVPAKRYGLTLNGESLGYTRAGIVVDHSTRRVRGVAMTLDADGDSFSRLLRSLRAGQTVQLNLKYGTTTDARSELEYDGAAEVVMIRERLSRLTVPAISFVFRMLGGDIAEREVSAG